MNREMLPSGARTPSAPNRASTRSPRPAQCAAAWSPTPRRRRRRGPRRAVPACGPGSRRPRRAAPALRAAARRAGGRTARPTSAATAACDERLPTSRPPVLLGFRKVRTNTSTVSRPSCVHNSGEDVHGRGDARCPRGGKGPSPVVRTTCGGGDESNGYRRAEGCRDARTDRDTRPDADPRRVRANVPPLLAHSSSSYCWLEPIVPPPCGANGSSARFPPGDPAWFRGAASSLV